MGAEDNQEKPARQGQISEETRKYLRAHRGEKRKRKDDDQAKQRVGKKAMTAKPRRKKPKKPVVSLWSRPKGEEWVGQARARAMIDYAYNGEEPGDWEEGDGYVQGAGYVEERWNDEEQRWEMGYEGIYYDSESEGAPSDYIGADGKDGSCGDGKKEKGKEKKDEDEDDEEGGGAAGAGLGIGGGGGGGGGGGADRGVIVPIFV